MMLWDNLSRVHLSIGKVMYQTFYGIEEVASQMSIKYLILYILRTARTPRFSIQSTSARKNIAEPLEDL